MYISNLLQVQISECKFGRFNGGKISVIWIRVRWMFSIGILIHLFFCCRIPRFLLQMPAPWLPEADIL